MNPPATLTNLAVKVDAQARRLGIHEYDRVFRPDVYRAELHATDEEVMRAVVGELKQRIAELFPDEAEDRP